ncbi:putative adhesin [Streptomyces sp. NPDC048362]|uniref:putative adhesin n=1 Tax=Streptomyces sp. NPDC048362 TaxID=3365539 RepID=UPI00371DE8A9
MPDTAYIVGHGVLLNSSDKFETPVTLHFYSTDGCVVYRGNGLAVLNTGGFSALGATESVPPGKWVSDYYLTPFNDSELIQHLALEGNSQLQGPLYIISDKREGPMMDKEEKKVTSQWIRPGTTRQIVDKIRKLQPEVRAIHSIACRVQFMRTQGGTIPLGGEPKREDDQGMVLRRGRESEFKFAPDDGRFTPLMRTEQLRREPTAGTVDGMQLTESDPYAIQAHSGAFGNKFLDDQGYRWSQVQSPDRWTTSDKSGTTPRIVWEASTPTPKTLNEAWLTKDWRDAFYLYLAGYYGGQLEGVGTVKANLDLWLRVNKWLSPELNIAIFTEEGDPVIDDRAEGELTAESVMDSEIIAFARGAHGPLPSVPTAMVDDIEKNGSRQAKLARVISAINEAKVEEEEDAEDLWLNFSRAIQNADIDFAAATIVYLIHSWMKEQPLCQTQGCSKVLSGG